MHNLQFCISSPFNQRSVLPSYHPTIFSFKCRTSTLNPSSRYDMLSMHMVLPNKFFVIFQCFMFAPLDMQNHPSMTHPITFSSNCLAYSHMHSTTYGFSATQVCEPIRSTKPDSPMISWASPTGRLH